MTSKITKTKKFLSTEQLKEIRRELISNVVFPVRFMFEGRTLYIESGKLLPRGINVIHQPFYWCFTRKTALKIAKWLNVKAVFSR